MRSVLGRRGAMRWRLLRPFRRRFFFSGAATEPQFWATSGIVYPNREQLRTPGRRRRKRIRLHQSTGAAAPCVQLAPTVQPFDRLRCAASDGAAGCCLTRRPGQKLYGLVSDQPLSGFEGSFRVRCGSYPTLRCYEARSTVSSASRSAASSYGPMTAICRCWSHKTRCATRSTSSRDTVSTSATTCSIGITRP